MVMAIVYGLYAFHATGSSYEKRCLANAVDFHPYAYQNQSDLDVFMNMPGSQDVSS